MFNVEIQKRWPYYNYLFTDGSKKGNNTACAVYQQYSGQQHKYKLPDEATICTAEMMALKFALSHALTQEMKNCVIFTDSKSTVERIGLTDKSKQLSHLDIEILKLYYEISKLGGEVIIAWIKGHSGIKGNIIADALAKEALSSGENINNNILPIADLDVCSKHQLRLKWQAFRSNFGNPNFFKKDGFIQSPTEFLSKLLID
uniref:Uncharacterized protein LOC114331389 n=1 Tax=Diabrotica virgifera virgifera TaxID=50390 RepID=A0A6P7FL71_DIAVI